MELGRNIAKFRSIRDIKSKELADLAGVRQSYISAIENGRKIPTLSVLQKIAKALDTTVSELLGETSSELSEDMVRLVDTAKDLNKEQVDAIISVVKELGGRYGK